MGFREFLRGTVEWDKLEAVARELARRQDKEAVRVSFLDAENWLSIPCVVDDQWFVKVISPQNSLVHALFTTGRNIGAFSAGTPGFFDHVADPLSMAEREFEATRRMRDAGLNAPRPVEAFETEGLGVLVLEFLPEFRTMGDLHEERVRELAPDVLALLSRMHDHRLVHGDLRAENVLLSEGDIHFIDATTVKEEETGFENARAYDVACAIATLAPLIGERDAVAAAMEAYPDEHVLAAREFLDFVNLRPDHDFDLARLKGEIEQAVDA